LRLGGREFERGIGVHAESEIACRIEPGYARFVAYVGIDDSQAPDGSMVARVLADDRVLDHSPLLRGGDPPWPVNVTIPPDARSLRLIVTDNGDCIAHDMADWAGAGFLEHD
jgi:hypothetical protein